MIDCQMIKQGGMYFVPDMSGETEVIFTGEHYPKKCRPWIVVSNDIANSHNTRVNIVPVYSRNRLSIPTDVYFTNGNRDCVACCNQVMSIEADKIDARGYVGTVSSEILTKIKKALCIQFGIIMADTTNEDDNIKTNIDTKDIKDTIKTDIVNNLNVGNIIAQELMKLLFNGKININTDISLSNIKPLDTKVIAVDSNAINTEKITNPTTKTSEKIEDVKISNKKSNGKRSYGKTMTIEQCKEFYKDAECMTNEELVSKWNEYGLASVDKNIITKKKSAIRYRLRKEGVI